MSIKVGQALSRRCRREVAETSPQSRGDVVATFPQSFGLEQTYSSSKTYLVVAASPRRVRDQPETCLQTVSEKKSNMFDFTATPSRPAKSQGDVAATSPPHTETRVANRSPTSLHASEIWALGTY